jgi:hypothetical protein
MRFEENEREEFRALSTSGAMRSDLAHVAQSRHDPFGGKDVDADAVIQFLTEYNEFLNHPIRPPRRFVEKNMKL